MKRETFPAGAPGVGAHQHPLPCGSPGAEGRSLSAKGMNQALFLSWLSQAQPGNRITYHTGFLAIDRSVFVKGLPVKEKETIGRLADCALKLADRGLVHLIQRRVKDGYEYIAEKRPMKPPVRGHDAVERARVMKSAQERGLRHREIAEEFGMSRGRVSQILSEVST